MLILGGARFATLEVEIYRQATHDVAPADQRLPGLFIQLAQQQQLSLAAGGLVPAQAGVDHAGVVGHQQIAGAQERRQLVEAMVGVAARRAVAHQQARGVARLGRLLGDQRRRQLVIQLRDAHGLV